MRGRRNICDRFAYNGKEADMRFMLIPCLILLAVPVAAQEVPPAAAEALINYIHREQESERVRAESLFGAENVADAVVIVVPRESMERHLGVRLPALQDLVGRLNHSGVPTRWCQLSCPRVGGDRGVSVTEVVVTSGNSIILQVRTSGSNWNMGSGRRSSWSRQDLVSLQRVGATWTVVGHSLMWIQ